MAPGLKQTDELSNKKSTFRWRQNETLAENFHLRNLDVPLSGGGGSPRQGQGGTRVRSFKEHVIPCVGAAYHLIEYCLNHILWSHVMITSWCAGDSYRWLRRASTLWGNGEACLQSEWWEELGLESMFVKGDTVTFMRKREHWVEILEKTWILTLWHCVRPLAFASPGCCVEGWRQRSIRVYLLKWSRSFLNNWICMTLLKNQIYLRNDKGVEVQSDCANVIAGLEYNATFFPASLIINFFLSLKSKWLEYLRNHLYIHLTHWKCARGSVRITWHWKKWK